MWFLKDLYSGRYRRWRDGIMVIMVMEEPKWVVLMGYGNLPGCPRPVDAVWA
jgi:hypothetical protein